MRSRLITAAILAASALASHAAFAAAIQGIVKNGRTEAPLAGVSIYVIETGDVTLTDENGAFAFADLPPGIWNIAAIDPAYQRADRAVTITGSPDPVIVELILVPQLVESNEILVEVDRDRPSPGATQLRREEITAVPGARGDLLTAVKSLPGVANNGAFGPTAGGLIIRGSGPEDSRVLVDGFEIPILYHFGSVQSVLPSEMIDDIVYEPGGFGVELGRSTGGAVSVTSRRGAREYGGFAELSFINGGVLAQGPIGKDATFSVAARRSFIDLLLPAALPDDGSLSFTTLPRYYDGQARFDYQAGDHDHLGLFIFGTDDSLALASTEVNASDPLAAGQFSNRTKFLRGIASWQHDSPGLYNRLAVSGLSSVFRFSVGRDRHVDLGTNSAIVRNEARIRLLEGVTLMSGGELELENVDVSINAPRAPREGDPGNPNFTLDPNVAVTQSNTRLNLAAWTGIELQLADWLKLTPGVRVDGFTRTDPDEYVIQPRIQAAATLAEGTIVRAAAGYYARPPINDENLQASLQSERAIQTTLGVEQRLMKGVDLQLTGFYTDRSNLVVYKNGRAGTGDVDNGYTNDGTGRTFGGEAMLRARTGPFFGWIAYTLSRSTKIDGLNASERLFDFDQTHNVVVVGSLELGDEKQWRVGARFQLTTGRPYTPVTGASFVSDANVWEPTYGAINSSRYDTQHQLDIRVDRTFRLEDWKLALYLDVANVYMNAAVLNYNYNYDYTQLEKFTNLPILPSIGIRGEI